MRHDAAQHGRSAAGLQYAIAPGLSVIDLESAIYANYIKEKVDKTGPPAGGLKGGGGDAAWT